MNQDQPSPYTSDAHHRALTDGTFAWDDRQDFKWARRGLIHRGTEPAILTAEGDIAWHHERFESFLSGEAPETVHPSLWRHALLNNEGVCSRYATGSIRYGASRSPT